MLKRLPVFRRLLKAPRRFTKDFRQLPPRMRQNLLSILEEHGGPGFDVGKLIGVSNRIYLTL